MRTSQNAFTIMRGHVLDGMEVNMNNGEVFTIRQNHRGWALCKADNVIEQFPFNAYIVESFIVNYTE